MRLELARHRDARAMAAMSRDLIERGLPWRWRAERLLHLMSDPETAVLRAHRDHELCGFAVMTFDWQRATAHLILLAVAPQERRRGLGSALLRWLEVVAQRGGVGRVVLEVRASSRGAQRFYRSLGYRSVAVVPGYYQGREDAVRMVAALGASTSAHRTRRDPAR